MFLVSVTFFERSFICLVLSPHSIPTLMPLRPFGKPKTGKQRPEPLSDDFLFSMSSASENRLSYASSPESDLEVSPPPAPRLVKSSSDPSIATTQDNLDRDDDMNHLPDAVPPPYSVILSPLLIFPFIVNMSNNLLLLNYFLLNVIHF